VLFVWNGNKFGTLTLKLEQDRYFYMLMRLRGEIKMTEYDYDVVYLGTGHGTFDGVVPLGKKTGMRLAVIEDGMIGGTCSNYGCNPKITLDAPVTMMRSLENMKDVLPVKDAHINWAASQKHKQEVIGGIPDKKIKAMTGAGVEIIHGYGILEDPHTVRVGNRRLSTDKIVVATGLHSHRLDIPGSELFHVSKDFLALTDMPKSIIVIGAGYIGMEFATQANAAGADVTVIMSGDRALKGFKQRYVERIIANLTKRGVTFLRNVNVVGAIKRDDQVVVSDSEGHEYRAEWVLDATGRLPNVEGFGLAEVGVAYNKNGIEVDDHLRTSVENIYAAGDVLDKTQPKLTPTAIFESKYLMHLFAGETTEPIRYPVIPQVVFTSPRISKVGLQSENISEADKEAYQVESHDVLNDWYRNVMNEQFGENELIFDANHKLVGATEISDYADQVADSLLPVIELGLDADQIEHMIHLFPSMDSSVWAQL
jgi:glutathione reductase (NADPH)